MGRLPKLGLVFAVIVGCSTTPTAERGPDHVVGTPPQPHHTEQPRIVIQTVEAEPRESDAGRDTSAGGLGMNKARITLDVRDADVHNVLRMLAEQGGANIVVDDTVQGRVTMRLENVTVEDAFLAVLDSLELGWTTRGSVTLVESGE